MNLWNDLKATRVFVGQNLSLDTVERAYIIDSNDEGYSDEEGNEEQKRERIGVVHETALPYFFALKQNMFELSNDLIPDASVDLNPPVTLKECSLLASKL